MLDSLTYGSPQYLIFWAQWWQVLGLASSSFLSFSPRSITPPFFSRSPIFSLGFSLWTSFYWFYFALSVVTSRYHTLAIIPHPDKWAVVSQNFRKQKSMRSPILRTSFFCFSKCVGPTRCEIPTVGADRGLVFCSNENSLTTFFGV